MTQPDATAYRAQILDPNEAADRSVLAQLQADPEVEFLDHRDAQLSGLRNLLPAPDDKVLVEPGRWAYYSWRRTVVAVLGPRGFRALRLDRNRNDITTQEQARLNLLTIGVAGLSVGHVIAHTLAVQGLCGGLRLADFDHLELSNLNRVPATVFDLGLNKAHVAARRIAELDPYLAVDVFDAGLTADTVDAFLDELDIVVEECDSLDMKAVLRIGARDRHIPVLMATSDRGRVDVERFDQEPERPILHGLLGQLDIGLLPGMKPGKDPSHAALRRSRTCIAPALLHHSLKSTDRCRPGLSWHPVSSSALQHWPKLYAESGRRKPGYGRCRIDIGWALDHLDEVEMPSIALRPKTSIETTQSLPPSTTLLSLLLSAPPRAERASHGISTRNGPNSPSALPQNTLQRWM